jgi:AMMECR1 domain-containing protein
MVGSKITLPRYSIFDNGNIQNVKVEVYVMSPSGLISDVKNNTIKLTRAGKHVIYYQVQDENGNVAFYSFEVMVGGAR